MVLSNFVRACLLIAFVISLNERALGLHEPQQQPHDSPLRAGRLQLDKPQEVVRTDGGSLRGWRSADILRCTQVDMCETTLKENGLLIPKYIDAPSVAYIMQGCGMVGISCPYRGEFQQYYMRRVRAGDVVAVPQGVVFWLYNDGKEEQRVMCVAETSKATNPGVSAKPFFLAGAKGQDFGGLWHGFSEDTLAAALGVDESTVRKLLTSQKEVVITKTRQKINLPLPEHMQHHEMNDVGGEFTFTTQSSKADLMVKNGGWLSMVTRNKLPILAHVGLSAVRVNLESDAMVAPLWSSNAHEIVRVLRGNGRIEVASNDGDRLLHTDLKENDVVVVPKFFPSTIIAGEDGLDLIKILTSDSPVKSYFAGANSVYKGIPPQVVAEAFGIDLEEELDIRRQRMRHEVILPPPKRHTGEHHRSKEDGCHRRESVEEKSDKDSSSLMKGVLAWADEYLKQLDAP